MSSSESSPDTCLELELPNAHCLACRQAVVNLLGQIDGVAEATFDARLRTTRIHFNDEVTSPAQIRQSLVEAGYPPINDGLVATSPVSGRSRPTPN
jgi:copper chaperone CopZ